MKAEQKPAESLEQTVLLCALGSLGDVSPILHLALACRASGMRPVVAATNSFKPIVEAQGLSFISLGEDHYWSDPEMRASFAANDTGMETFFRVANAAISADILDDLIACADKAAVIVSTLTVMSAHLISQASGKPLLGCCFSPVGLLKGINGARVGNDFFYWQEQLGNERARLGLPRRSIPQADVIRHPQLILGMYPKFLHPNPAELVRDVAFVGFPGPSVLVDAGDPAELLHWCRERKFVAMSFGSYIDRMVDEVFEAGQKACANLGLRCLFISPFGASRIETSNPEVRIEQFAPHLEVAQLAEVFVHHGGIGTLTAVCNAHCPAVIVPFSTDQPYNAAAVVRRGWAQQLLPDEVNADSLTLAIGAAMAKRARINAEYDPVDQGVGAQAAQRGVEIIKAVISGRLASEPA